MLIGLCNQINTKDSILNIIKIAIVNSANEWENRKILNISQSCIKNNQLVLDAKLVNQSGVGNLILDQLRNKSKDSFNNIRQILADSNIRDYTEYYKLLFDNTSSSSDIINIGESQYQSMIHPDKEICFMTCFAKLLNN